jgi:hypothetical protein
MASPATTPRPPEPRAPWGVRLALALAIALPMALAASGLLQDGWLSDTHGAFLQRVRFAVERNRLELLGFEYPPLPFVLLIPWTSPWAALLLGTAAIAGLAWMVVNECTDRRSVLPLVLLAAALWNPIGLHLVSANFNEALGLLALFIGWQHYRRWWATRQTIYGLYTGLWLGVAFYTSPLGLALALVAGAILPILFPRLQIPPFASQLVLIAFPGIAATATWAYLSWIFTGQVKFPFSPWEPDSPTFVQMVPWALPYLFVGLVVLLRPKVTTVGMLLPLLLLAAANRTGWHFSLGFAMVLLTLVAIVALPRDLPSLARPVLVLLAIAQAGVAWWKAPWPALGEADLAARAVATALAPLPPRSVLLDDRYAERLLKWSPSLEPFLTTRDTGYELGVQQPMDAVRYVLAVRDEAGYTFDADQRPPAGFLPEWEWRGYALWRHPDAPRVPIAFDAVPLAAFPESR